MLCFHYGYVIFSDLGGLYTSSGRTRTVNPTCYTSSCRCGWVKIHWCLWVGWFLVVRFEFGGLAVMWSHWRWILRLSLCHWRFTPGGSMVGVVVSLHPGELRTLRITCTILKLHSPMDLSFWNFLRYTHNLYPYTRICFRWSKLSL